MQRPGRFPSPGYGLPPRASKLLKGGKEYIPQGLPVGQDAMSPQKKIEFSNLVEFTKAHDLAITALRATIATILVSLTVITLVTAVFVISLSVMTGYWWIVNWDVKSTAETNQDNIVVLQECVEQTKSDISIIQVDIDGIQTNVSVLKQNASQFNESIVILQGNVTDLQTQIDNISSVTNHSLLDGLSNDDHTQYALVTGRPTAEFTAHAADSSIHFTEDTIDLTQLGSGVSITSGDRDVKSLVGGPGILISSTSTEITLETNFTDIQENITLNNLGLGEPLSPGGLGLKSLQAGNGVLIVSDSEEITITANVTLNASTLELMSVGAGEEIPAGGLLTKSLTQGTGITLNSSSTEINIAADIADLESSLSLNQLGSGLVLAPSGLNVKSLNMSQDFTTAENADNVYVELNYTQVEDTITISSLGTGEDFTTGSSGAELKSITSSGGTITITSNANEVNVETNFTQVEQNIDLNSLGAGETLAPGGVDVKSLVGGTNINLVSDANTVTINGPSATLNQLGAGEDIKGSGDLDVKSLTSSSGSLTITSDANEINLETNFTEVEQNIDLNSLGAGETLAPGGVDVKSLVAGTNINLTSDANTVTISASGGSSPVLNQLGGGEAVKGSGDLDVKSFVEGEGINITSNSSTITIETNLVLEQGVTTTVLASQINVAVTFLVLGTAHYQRVGSVVYFGGLFGNLTMGDPNFPFEITADISAMGFPTAISSTIVGACGCATELEFIGYSGAAVYPCAVNGNGGDIQSAGALVESVQYDNCDLSYVGSYVTSDP